MEDLQARLDSSHPQVSIPETLMFLQPGLDLDSVAPVRRVPCNTHPVIQADVPRYPQFHRLFTSPLTRARYVRF